MSAGFAHVDHLFTTGKLFSPAADMLGWTIRCHSPSFPTWGSDLSPWGPGLVHAPLKMMRGKLLLRHFSWAILNIESVYLHLDAIPTITNRRIIASYCFNASSPPSKWESSRHHLEVQKKTTSAWNGSFHFSIKPMAAPVQTLSKIIYQLPVTQWHTVSNRRCTFELSLIHIVFPF